MVLAEMQHRRAQRYPHIERQVRLEPMFEVDLEAEEIKVELPRLADIEHPQGGSYPGKLRGHERFFPDVAG